MSEAPTTLLSMLKMKVAPWDGRYFILFSSMLILLFISFFVAVGVGPKWISVGEVVNSIWTLAMHWEITGVNQYIVTQIRLPRVLMAMMIGSALAVSGAAMQGMFRNPLADPGLIGINSGAAFAATLAIVLGQVIFGAWYEHVGPYILPVGAFLGALAVASVIYALSRRAGQTVVATLLLAGVAISALCGAGIGVLVYMADNQQLRDISFWNLGGLTNINWKAALISSPLMLAAIFCLPRWSRQLDLLLLGEQQAYFMGVNTERLKSQLIIVVALAVGAAVSISGAIGFVGLVVPHLVRLMLGPNHQRLMPCSILMGALLLLWADLGARTLNAPAEIPVGIITALIGAPFFLWLLLNNRQTIYA